MSIWEYGRLFDYIVTFHQITWISLVLYVFYDTFIYYKNGRQFYHLRRILGLGLCVSRGTAAVLNICCALVLLPLCKKLNQVMYAVLGQLVPKVFFLWLESTKSLHMTVAVTLVVFAVVHSISHLANLWNFSRGYDATMPEINFASYRDESTAHLLMSQAGLTGVSMLAITVAMGLTSLRVVRRKVYNAFWYTHQLYLLFMMLLIIHPLSGALKEEVLIETESSPYPSQSRSWSTNSSSTHPKFTAIKSKTWQWMALPLICFSFDLLWRILRRNRTRIDIQQVIHMPGRTVSLTLSCPDELFYCRMGQYVLLQCADISSLEWHPYTVVKVPTHKEKHFVVWIRVAGDWTESLEKLFLERGSNAVSILVDGPFSSPMERVVKSEIAICVAAGVGITPFVALLSDMLRNPRGRFPGRIHLLWIVRHEREITWLADLATKCILQLRNHNRPDRVQLELYVTASRNIKELSINDGALSHMVVVNERGDVRHVVEREKYINDERQTLLTPNIGRNNAGRKRRENWKENNDNNYDLSKEYPILGCRVRRGRPHWDRVFGYWVHLYPGARLNLFCCGPKKLVKLLRRKCSETSRSTKTKFTFVHEGFA